jgi:hypothetical protein
LLVMMPAGRVLEVLVGERHDTGSP